MKRDLSDITRTLDDVKSNDIIYKKSVIKEIFNADPDLKEVLGQLDTIPLNKYADKEHPTEEELKERARIIDYNDKVSHPQILSFLKVNDIQKEVLNFVMFDIEDERPSYTNEILKQQYLTVMCLVHEDDMDTEYGVDRIDLLSYIIEDLLCWSNVTGLHLKLYDNKFGITDTKYYSRTLRFLIKATNTNNFRHGRITNSYEQV
jgi:hypothetical protein